MVSRCLLLLCVATITPNILCGTAPPNPPNIIMMLIDDLGWNNVGYHGNQEVKTPNLDSLVGEGIELDRLYGYKKCSPSRSAILTGRLPMHVNTENSNAEIQNQANDPISGYAGIPLGMSTMSSKLKSVGYSTHFVGKWDVGMATEAHTPRGRGFDTDLSIFHHSNDAMTLQVDPLSSGPPVCLPNPNFYEDLWDGNQPAARPIDGEWEPEALWNRAKNIIETHNETQRLFLYYSFREVHTSLRAPSQYLEEFSSIDNYARKAYNAMLFYMDLVIGELVSLLKSRSLWDNTLIVFMSDNGGPIYSTLPLNHFNAGANNYPLRGGKYSDFEGGVRIVGGVSGGFVPPAVRGTTLSKYIHIVDWYTTFCELAGVDPADSFTVQYNQPHTEVDGFNVWPLLSGETTESPHEELHLSRQALIKGPYKLLVGYVVYDKITSAVYPNNNEQQPDSFLGDSEDLEPGADSGTLAALWAQLEQFPVPAIAAMLGPIATAIGIPVSELVNNLRDTIAAKQGPVYWEKDCTAGCLYNILQDPSENVDLATQRPVIVAQMTQRLNALNQNVFQPDRGTPDQAACLKAEENGGVYGPWLPVPPELNVGSNSLNDNNNALKVTNSTTTALTTQQSSPFQTARFYIFGFCVAVVVVLIVFIIVRYRRMHSENHGQAHIQMEDRHEP